MILVFYMDNGTNYIHFISNQTARNNTKLFLRKLHGFSFFYNYISLIVINLCNPLQSQRLPSDASL